MENEVNKGGGKYTFGTSKAAVNLMGDILGKPEHKHIRGNALSLLSRQDFRLNTLMDIGDKNVRESSLLMWHKHFTGLVEDYPEVVKTHVLNVETAIYRRLMKESKKKARVK